jgi:uncharacterized protein (DUF779 family)
MAEDQYQYWQHTQLTVDVTPGRGASFSLEIPLASVSSSVPGCLPTRNAKT